MYAVVSGVKTFTLLPPTDILHLPEKDFPTRKFCLKKPESGNNNSICSSSNSSSSSGSSSKSIKLKVSELELTSDDCPSESISWIPCDPDRPASIQYRAQQLSRCSPIRCEVLPGEILYIPSMWYHRVSQTCLTVAVNFWYDQRFNFRYVLYNYVRSTKLLLEEEEEEVED